MDAIDEPTIFLLVLALYYAVLLFELSQHALLLLLYQLSKFLEILLVHFIACLVVLVGLPLPLQVLLVPALVGSQELLQLYHGVPEQSLLR